MSYTTFSYTNLRLSPENMKKGETLTVSVTLTNSGKRTGQEVVQLYIRDIVASVTRPVRMLRGFQKIELDPAQSKEVTFSITAEDLMIYDLEMRPVVEEGIFEVYVGGDSTAGLKTSFRFES